MPERRTAAAGARPGAGGLLRLSPRALRCGAGLALAALLATRIAAIFTVAVNWDELALLSSANRTAETGVLHDHGRPGLAVLLLLPLAGECHDEIGVVRLARALWLAITLAFLIGLAVLLARLQRSARHRWTDAAVGVALLALVPAFLEWSIQVRTDQIALAAGVWGGVALLASRRRPGRAPLAGLLFGLGYLSTEKLLYVGALMALVAGGDLLLDRELRVRRELARGALCAAAMGAVILVFDAATEAAFAPRPGRTAEPSLTLTLAHGFSVFDFYRKTLGYSQYREMLPTLAPHFSLAALLAVATGLAHRRRAAGGRKLLLAWSVLALGLGVGLFHAGAFSYFWMTLGLFPAVALAVALDPIRELLVPVPRRIRSLCAAGFAAMLAIPALLQIGWHLSDTQSVQVRSLALIHRNFSREDAGFHPESGLFCQTEPEPFPTYFSQRIYRLFGGPDREENAARMIEAFQQRSVKFVLDSWRLRQFPQSLQRFWLESYPPYRDAVRIAGRRFSGRRGTRSRFELVVAGRYRWLPGDGPQPIQIDGIPVPAGHAIELDRGPHTAELRDDLSMGMLVLAIDDPPGPASKRFYKAY